MPHLSTTERLISRILLQGRRVRQALGAGHGEMVYHRAMVQGLRRWGLKVQDRPTLRVRYQGLVVARYVPDCIVQDGQAVVIVDFKATDWFDQADFDQMRLYLGACRRAAVGLLLGFGGSRLSYRKVVLRREG